MARRAFGTALLVLMAAASSAKPKLIEYPPTYRDFPYSYEKVWNAVVRVVIEDMKFYPQAADPKEGFLSTGWKVEKGAPGKNDLRVRMHLNVKRSPSGALVTARCELEEYVPVKGTGKGRWMPLPSDHSCEKKMLDAVEKKLARN